MSILSTSQKMFTRKRAAAKHVEKVGEEVAMENQNSNHSAAADKCRKISKNHSKKVDIKLTEEGHQATFPEDDDVVNMYVEGTITNNGEINSEEDETDDEADEPNPSQSDDEIQNNSMEQEAEQQSDDENNEEEDQKREEKCMRKQERRERRASMEQLIESLSSSVKIMQQMMASKGFAEPTDSQRNWNNRQGKTNSTESGSDHESETAIYQNAVPKLNTVEVSHIPVQGDPEIAFKRNKDWDSSSSEERINTSDEMMDEHDHFIAECAAQADKMKNQMIRHELRDEGERIVCEAEANKADLYATPGNQSMALMNPNSWNVNLSGPQVNANSVDNNYLLVGAHVDPSLQLKIVRGEYVDFACLLPKSRYHREEENRLEIISKGGLTYFVPATDRESGNVINSFGKWEQAF